jgi:hypothetical protein
VRPDTGQQSRWDFAFCIDTKDEWNCCRSKYPCARERVPAVSSVDGFRRWLSSYTIFLYWVSQCTEILLCSDAVKQVSQGWKPLTVDISRSLINVDVPTFPVFSDWLSESSRFTTKLTELSTTASPPAKAYSFGSTYEINRHEFLSNFSQTRPSFYLCAINLGFPNYAHPFPALGLPMCWLGVPLTRRRSLYAKLKSCYFFEL